MVIRMPDIYPDFPYRWVSWPDWMSKVDTMVSARLAATTVTNVEAWELWNEPDWTWNTSAAGDVNAGWTRTFQQVRSRDPATPILGPSISGWNVNWMRTFLTNARNTNTLPDIVCWHELNHSGPQLAADVAAYRALERELGISPRPISINEYAWTDEVYVPGIETSYISKLERDGRPRLLERVRHGQRPGREQHPADRTLVALQVVRRPGRQHGHHHPVDPDRPGRLRRL